MNELKNLLDKFVIDPEDPINNLNLAKFYHSIDQTSSAVSYYTRTAERTEDKTLMYDYPGYYGILFEKAVSSWWCGLCDDSRDYFLELKTKHWDEMDEIHKNAVMNNLKILKVGFDWGHAAENRWFKDTVEKEIFVDNVYQKFFEVENDDVVFDVGASSGPFTFSIKDKNPSKVYCFEPHSELFKNLTKNVESDNVVCVNKAIGPVDGSFETSGLFNKDLRETSSEKNTQTVPSVKFSTFIKENNIEKIDFLKSDCEGGEYDIFNDENLPWIKKNVKKIAGEWHLTTPEQKEKFLSNQYLYRQ